MQLRSIFDVASHLDSLPGTDGAAAFKRIYRITSGTAACTVGSELSAKYQVQQDNVQHVVSVTNLCTLEQTYFNQARTTKPQTFKGGHAAAASLDPTANGANCDFCSWKTLTAQDPGFGRIQLPHAVTASNLFKYAEPSHGVVLFRHHDPLAFSQPALSDLLDASWLWFQASHKLNPHADQPFLLWNCLPRGGASQYHGHAQVMLGSVAVPGVEKLRRAASSYRQQHPGCCYYADLLQAHAAVGLARQVSIPADSQTLPSTTSSRPSSSGSSGNGSSQQQQQEHVAWGFASVAPVKDMEITVIGQHMCCPAFQHMLHAALRGLIDGLGVATFNLGLLNVDLAVPAPCGVGEGRSFWVRAEPRGSSASAECSNDGDGGSSSSSSGGDSSSSSDMQLPLASSSGGHFIYGSSSSSSSGSALWLPDAGYWAGRAPVVARLVSRGKLSNAASDFGGLEVWGGASIGHTDPFTVVQQLDMQLAAGLLSVEGLQGALAN